MQNERSNEDITTQGTSKQIFETQPLRQTVSGLYTTAGTTPGIAQQTTETANIRTQTSLPSLTPVRPNAGAELRLDVDRLYPQMTASGTIPLNALRTQQWIARLTPTGLHRYEGGIWHKTPAETPFAYTTVRINVQTGPTAAGNVATVIFSGGGLPDHVQTYRFRSPYFHKVEFEIDHCEGIDPVTTVNTGDHPNHPATLPVEQMGIDTVFRRCGLDVSWNPHASTVPIQGAGPNAQWSDTELNDAMITYWSRFANKAQWALWAFIANQHEMGPSLGGIMFDDIGRNERQGTAVFYNSFISEAPQNDTNPTAFIARNRFWTTVHEIGHCFNLAHSWQKSLAVSWIPLADEPEARSFMNYPYRVTGGQSAFWADFEYRFSDNELLFMRHAPNRFVEMGAADWFDNHGIRQTTTAEDTPLQLEMRLNRGEPAFEFLEPIVIELKLKNVSDQPRLVDEHLLEDMDRIVVGLKRENATARRYTPLARYCRKPSTRVLMPNEAMYCSVFVWAGANGLDMAEPGRYILQACLNTETGLITSNLLTLRVATPVNREEERIAQDVLTRDVGRILAFDGSNVLRNGIEALQNVIARLPERRIARHARVALGTLVTRQRKVLTVADTVRTNLVSLGTIAGTKITQVAAKVDEARTQLTTALMQGPDVAAESLGHIDYKCYVDLLTDFLAVQGDRKEAAQIQQQLHKTLAARGVLKSVLEDIVRRRESYGGAAAAAR